jgi:hypothetical protein
MPILVKSAVFFRVSSKREGSAPYVTSATMTVPGGTRESIEYIGLFQGPSAFALGSIN